MNMMPGKKVMHSASSPRPTGGNRMALGPGSVRMPAAMPVARINVPKDHTCKVCPGANRK